MTKSVPAHDTDLLAVARKPRGWRRAMRIFGKLVAGVLVLIVLLVAFLHTSWGKAFVRGRIESRLNAMVNGSASLASLDYGFLFSSVELGGLEIRDAQGAPAIKLERLALDVDRGALLGGELKVGALAISGLDVAVVKRDDGTTNLTGLFKPSDRKPLKHVAIGKLTVAGTARLTRPDGTVITVRDLAVAGNLDARPVAQELDAAIETIAAKVEIKQPTATRNVEVSIAGIAAKRRPEGVEVAIAKVAAGAIGIEQLDARVRLVDGKLHGEQKLALGKLKLDRAQLVAFLGRELLVDDVALDLSITGPETALVIAGNVKTGSTTLAITGTADVAAVPTYQLRLAGKGKSTDVSTRGRIAVDTDLELKLAGRGLTPLDLDATVELVVGPTKVGQLALDSLTARGRAQRGAYQLERLAAHGLEFDVTATGALAADKAVTGKITVVGSPAKAIKLLAAAGIAVPRKVPEIGHVDLALDLTGNLEKELAVVLAPTKIALAGGSIGLAGTATLEARKLKVATTKLQLANLSLGSLAALAGRPPKLHGTLSGTVDLTKTPAGQHADYALAVALRDQPLTITARGSTEATRATARAEVRRTGDPTLLATIDAALPLDPQGFQPRGAWRVKLDLANRQLADLRTLLPEHLRTKLPAGDVAVRVELAGSPVAPTGTIALTAHAALPDLPGTQTVELTGTLVPSRGSLAILTKGSVALAGSPQLALLEGRISMPFAWIGKQLDREGLRAGLMVDAAISLPERPVASLASVRPKLASIDGTIGGRILAKGPLKRAVLDAQLAWRGYRTAAGTTGETTLAATGTATAPHVEIQHNGLAIRADVDRENPARLAIKAQLSAQHAALPLLVPAFVGARVPAGAQLGQLSTDLGGDIILAKTDAGMQVDAAALTGRLDVTGGAFQLPGTKRSYRDIGLAIVAEPAGLRLEGLTVHERDLEKPDRTLKFAGLIALDRLKAKRIDLTLAARDWLVFGGEKFGAIDSPRATATFDIGAAVDLTTPIPAIDATIHALALRSPDRLERGHFVEKASVAGDVIFAPNPTGQLPVAEVVPVAPSKKRPLDIRVHIPRAIRLEQTPMDVMAKGEVTVAVREAGTKITGGLTIERGTLNLFGRDHQLRAGSVTFDEAHPGGEMALTFERTLPEVAMRELARSAGTSRVTFAGSPSKPKTSLSGATNAAMLEVMAMYNAGRPTVVARPGLPASPQAQGPRGDQLFILTFMASNLPHLLFLDRIDAWSDPDAAAYGQISNLEADHYREDGKTRVRAVARPARTSPGRSTAELGYDRMLINNDRAAVGVGVRAGDRLGGGVGVFVEWSSED